jgi:outer membrane usher protein
LGASSSATQGKGQQWLLGLEKTGLNSSGALQAQGASLNFRQLGLEAAPPRLQVAANVSYSSPTLGTLGAGFAAISAHASDTQAPQTSATLSANYTAKITERATLNVVLSQLLTEPRGSALGVTLVLPLGGKVISTANLQRRGADQDVVLAASKNQDVEQPVSWRLLTGHQRDADRAEGGLYYLGRYGQINADLSAANHQTALRLGAMGALVLAENRLFASQRLDDSFALVELAGYPDVGVGLGSTLLTRTDSQGFALLGHLVPYQQNAIRLDPSAVPLSADIESIEKIGVPRPRSAVKISFPVRSGRAALVRILFDDGEPAPAGAVVSATGDTEVFYVARRGEAFMTGLQATNRLILQWKDQQCTLQLDLPEKSAEDVLRLGPLACQGVQR